MPVPTNFLTLEEVANNNLDDVQVLSEYCIEAPEVYLSDTDKVFLRRS